MREMKDSGIKWIGEIPKYWALKRIKHTANLNGRIGWQGLTSKEYQYEGAILVTGVDFSSGRINWENCYRVSFERWKQAPEIQLKNGDLLITKDGTVGKIAIVKDLPQKATLNSGVLKITLETRINTKFMYWVLLSEEFWRWFTYKNAGSSTIIHLYQNDFTEFKYAVPPLTEQQAIADFLDAKCADIDSLTADIQKQINLLKEYKKSVITQAVTKGLDPNVEMKDSGIAWCPRIPKHWNPINPKVLFTLRTDRAKQGQRQLTASQKYGIIYQDEFMEKESQKVVTVIKDFSILKQVKPNDFVISMRSFQGGLEYSALSGSISSAYVMLIPNSHKVYPRFYRYFFKSSKYINAIQSTSNLVRDGQAMRYSNFAQVYLFDIPMEEQKKITDYLDNKIPKIDAIISGKQKQLDVLKEYKKSLIYEYVTGKKEVPCHE